MAEDFSRLPAPASVRLIDFKTAKLRPIPIAFGYLLSVKGTKPCLNMLVELSPLVYVQQPDYWGIEVVGSLSGACIRATAPYALTEHIVTLGKKGIEVIGANKSVKIDFPGASGGSKKAAKKPAKKTAKKPTKKGGTRK